MPPIATLCDSAAETALSPSLRAFCSRLGVGRSVDETLRVLEAFQFVAKNGEVCPANWKKGSDTMKPDPKGSQEYFKKQK